MANIKDMVYFTRKRQVKDRSVRKDAAAVRDSGTARLEDRLDNLRMEDIVMEVLGSKELQMLPEVELESAIRTFVEKDEKDSISRFVAKTTREFQSSVKGRNTDNNRAWIKDELRKEKKEREERMRLQDPSIQTRQRAQIAISSPTPEETCRDSLENETLASDEPVENSSTENAAEAGPSRKYNLSSAKRPPSVSATRRTATRRRLA